jgi:GNAT superfamily N-acetyltransferase
LCFRSIRAEEDTDELYAVHAGRITHGKVDLLLHNEDLPSRDGLRNKLSQAVAVGEQDQWLVAQIHERVVGYSQLASWHEDDEMWVFFIGGWVLPEWRGKGIGTAMLHWGENVARQLAAVQHPNERFEFAANASCTEQDATALLLNEGYYVGFTTLEMRFDISTTLPATPPLPDDIEVRSALPEHYPLIISSIIEAYQNAFPENRFRTTFDRVAYYSAELRKPKYDPKLWHVA